MPILNNIPRKHTTLVKTGSPLSGPFEPRQFQKIPLGYEGLSYNSQFTESGIPPMGNHFNIATQPQLPAIRHEQPGQIVAAVDYVKVPPDTRSASFSVGQPARPIVNRAGGPSPTQNTAFHIRSPRPPVRRVQLMPSLSTEKAQTAAAVATSANQRKVPFTVIGKVAEPVGSFLQGGSGQTLSQHVHNDLAISRWTTIKKGAAG
jgi:hypothetical protein